MDKTGRNGIRVGDINTDYFMQKYEALKNKHLHLLERMPDVAFDLQQEEAKWMLLVFQMEKYMITCHFILQQEIQCC